MATRFPQEILLSFLVHFHDPDTTCNPQLANTSLVCREWANASQTLLFASIHLVGESPTALQPGSRRLSPFNENIRPISPKRMLTLFRSAPHLVPNVRRLHIGGGNFCGPALIPLLNLIGPTINHLSMSDYIFAWDGLDRGVTTILELAILPNVRRLLVWGISGLPPHFLTLCKRAQVVNLGLSNIDASIALAESRQDQPEQLAIRALHVVAVLGSGLYLLDSHVISLLRGKLIGISQLVITTETMSANLHKQLSAALGDLCGRFVTDLHVTLDASFIHLLPFKNLKQLSLKWTYHIPSNVWQTLRLRHIRCTEVMAGPLKTLQNELGKLPVLTQFHLEVPDPLGFTGMVEDNLELTCLDDPLSALENFTLTFPSSGWADHTWDCEIVQKKMEHLFVNCHVQGILQVRQLP
ncbi:hypothetical protein DL96DRAFT_103788 [Flagelloscypha sp. PMI_526]|nr:hypothetical protein DL96DRAFT_103788 [Flagelloscypha sp. PMI_526]